MLLSSYSLALLGVSAGAFALALMGSLVAAAYFHTNWKRKERSLFGVPIWSDASSGLLVGGSDFMLAGAVPVERSAFMMLQKWVGYNGAHVGMVTDRDAAESFFSRGQRIDWALYAPSLAQINEAFTAVDEEKFVAILAKAGQDINEWLELLTRHGVDRIGIITVHDPLSAPELSAPAQQSRMARIIDKINGLLQEYGSKYDVEVLDVAEVLNRRSGEFTRSMQGSPYLNNLGHAVLLGRIKVWLLHGKDALQGAVRAQELFELAINLRGR